MNSPLLNELQQNAEALRKSGWLSISDLVTKLKELPRYRQTPANILRLNLEKLQERKSKDRKAIAQEAEPILEKRPNGEEPLPQNSQAKPLKFENSPKVFLKDLGGLSEIKARARDFISANISHRALYSALGLSRSPKHLIIHGPQGTGKSTLAAAIANESGLDFLKLTLFDPRLYSSLNEGRITGFAKAAKQSAPCVIILEDMDSFFSGESLTKESERKMLQGLLWFFDEIADSDVFVFGTVSKVEKISSALLRSGRFDTRLDLKIPDEFEREQILLRMIEGKRVGDLDVRDLGITTAGFVASDLQSLVAKAAELAILDFLNSTNGQKDIKKEFTQSAFQNIFGKESPNEFERSLFEKENQAQSDANLRAVIKTGNSEPENDQHEEQTKEGSELAISISQSQFARAIPLIIPIIKKEGFTSVPSTSWSDIGALDSLKRQLDHLIIRPILNPEVCAKFSIRRQAGVLLYGPPGCGKTMLAKAVANACRANFIYVKGPELLSKYVGESEKAVRGLFERAKLSAPCLVFFDEIDGLCPKRGSDGNQVVERVVNQLLTEMNGVEELNQIYIVGATNRPDIIDRAVLRPERLGVHLFVPLPNKADRIDILRTILKNRPVNEDVSPELIEQRFCLENYSGADLNALVEAAARNAAWADQPKEKITINDFLIARQSSKASITLNDIAYYNDLFDKFK